jgi:hypothetical protein
LRRLDQVLRFKKLQGVFFRKKDPFSREIQGVFVNQPDATRPRHIVQQNPPTTFNAERARSIAKSLGKNDRGPRNCNVGCAPPDLEGESAAGPEHLRRSLKRRGKIRRPGQIVKTTVQRKDAIEVFHTGLGFAKVAAKITIRLARSLARQTN